MVRQASETPRHLGRYQPTRVADDRVAEGAGIDLEKARTLPPMPEKPAPGQNRRSPTCTDGRREEAVPHLQAAEYDARITGRQDGLGNPAVLVSGLDRQPGRY